MRAKLLAAPIFAACVVVAAACGSDSDSGDEAKVPTKSEYIKQADDICSAAQKSLEDDTKELDESSDADQPKIVDAIVTSTQDELKQLRALTPPEGDAETVDKIYDTVDSAVGILADKGIDGFAEAGPKLAEAGDLAKDYGFTKCGQDDAAEPEVTATTSAAAADAPTKADYIVEADAICTSLQTEFETAATAMGENPDDAAIGIFQTTVSSTIRDYAAQLRDLTPPAGDEEVLDNVYTELEGAADTIESTPTAQLLTIDDPFEAADQAAQDYGFTVCGS